MLRFYQGLLTLIFPLLLLRLWWRGCQVPAYRARWQERCGVFSLASEFTGGVWLHAVSLGEVNAAAPLIRALLAAGLPVTITSTTPTGSARVQALFASQVGHIYAPFDLPGPVRRAMQRIGPRLLIVMETELWPTLYQRCQRQGVPVLLANARLSPHSYRGFKRAHGFMRQVLAAVTCVAAQTESDAERFRAIGAAPDTVRVLGNIKFDMALPEDMAEKAAQLRQFLGENRPVWVVGSTHAGEETMVLEAMQLIRQQQPNALLVLVPRHPERFAGVAEQCRAAGHAVVCHSEQTDAIQSGHLPEETAVYLVDAMGELLYFYGATDVAVVAGSFIDTIGGHNLLEPALLKKPVVSGSYLFNFIAIRDILMAADALVQVADVQALSTAILSLFSDAQAAQALGEKGFAALAPHRKAAERHMAVVQTLLT